MSKADSYKALDTKNVSNAGILWVKLKWCFYFKVKGYVLGLLIFHITHILKVSIMKITFETDFCMKDGFVPNFLKLK